MDGTTHRAPNGHGVLSALSASHLLQLSGSPYERGWAHGFLLEPQIIDWSIIYNLASNMQGDRAWYDEFGRWLIAEQFVPTSFDTEIQGILAGMAAAAASRNGSLYVKELGRDYGLVDLYLTNACTLRPLVSLLVSLLVSHPAASCHPAH